MAQHERGTAYYHLPGLFEFYELYRVFLPLFREHREYFYDWCEIGSVYGAPADCIWGGGRTGFGDAQPHRVLALMQEYGISARLTFSNSLLRKEHLADRKCNALCALFEKENRVQNGVIVHSDLLLDYLRAQPWYHDYEVVPSAVTLVELTAKGANKGGMVRRLADLLGVTRENVICVGDHANDISMLTWAGQGYAPANAIPQVLHTPGVRRLPDCRDNAIAQLIRSLDKQL